MDNDIPKYNLYKGLSKPLIFKGLIGKYIYIGGIGLLVNIILTLVLASVLGFLTGLIIGGCSIAGLFLYIKSKQEKGIYNKRRDDKTLFYIENMMKHHKFNRGNPKD